MVTEEAFRKSLNNWVIGLVGVHIALVLTVILTVLFVDVSIFQSSPLGAILFVLGVVAPPVLLGLAVGLLHWRKWDIEELITDPFRTYWNWFLQSFETNIILLVGLGIAVTIVEMVVLSFLMVGVVLIVPILGGIALIIYLIVSNIFGFVAFFGAFNVAWRLFNLVLRPKLEKMELKVTYTQRG
jgi:hypothetical protein